MDSERQIETEPLQLPVMPGRIREAVLLELDSLNTLIQGLSLAEWKQPSAAKGWSIGDVVSHLNLALGLYSRLLHAIVAGRGSGSAWKAFGQLSKKAGPLGSPVFNAINNAIPRMMSGAISPETLKGQFAAEARGVRERLEKVEPHDYSRPAHYMGRPWPLSFFLASTVNELAVHGWDIASTRDRSAHLSEEARSILPWFYWGASSFMFRPATAITGTVQVSLVDPTAEMSWSIVGNDVKPEAGQVEHPDVTITGESGTFVLVLAGRIGTEAALRDTSITADGNETLAKEFLGAWKIV